MLRVDSAISKVRRDITLAALLKAAFFAAVLGSLMIGAPYLKVMSLTAVVFLWVWLNVASGRGSRLAADSPSLIAAGRYDEAEARIEQAMRTFSIFRGVKLQSLYQLALLRHAQRRWDESAALCRALLRQKPTHFGELTRQSRLILADSLLETNDLAGASEALSALYRQRLSLADVLKLLVVQLDYESRVGAWPSMMNDLPTKVQLAELMPTAESARAQALLALAAMKTGRPDWSDWLRRRVELLTDFSALADARPALKQIMKAS